MIKEMARQTGQYPSGSFNSQATFDWITTDFPEEMKVIQRNLTSKKYDVSMTDFGGEISFWVTQNGEFQGRVQGIKDKKDFIIETTEKKKSMKGFYALVFPVILTKFKRILSDTKLSPSAVGAYLKLEKSILQGRIKIQTKTGVVDFDKDVLFDKIQNRIVVEEDQEDLIEHFNQYHRRVEKLAEGKSFLHYMHETNLDIWLLGDSLDNL